LVESRDPLVRGASIWALGQIGGPQAKQALLEVYKEADDDTRNAVEEALAEMALQEGELNIPLYAVSTEEDDLFWDEEEDEWDEADDQDWES
jgi:HEAT repeat protein